MHKAGCGAVNLVNSHTVVTLCPLVFGNFDIDSENARSTGWPGCLVLKQGTVNWLFLGVFLMFLSCLDHARWAKFHLGILGPQE